MDPLLEPPPAVAAPPRLPRRREPWMAVVLGLVLPGLGHVYAGRPLKAALHLIAILGLFVVGLSLTGWTAVHPRKHPLEFAAHAWLGLPSIVAWQYGENFFLEELPRWMEVGRLFAAIAGLLNVVAVCDALGEIVGHNVRVQAARRAATPPLVDEAPLPPPEANGLAAAMPSDPFAEGPLRLPAPMPTTPASSPPEESRAADADDVNGDPPPLDVLVPEPPPSEGPAPEEETP